MAAARLQLVIIDCEQQKMSTDVFSGVKNALSFRSRSLTPLGKLIALSRLAITGLRGGVGK